MLLDRSLKKSTSKKRRDGKNPWVPHDEEAQNRNEMNNKQTREMNEEK